MITKNNRKFLYFKKMFKTAINITYIKINTKKNADYV